MRTLSWLSALALIAGLTWLGGLSAGSFPITFAELWQVFSGEGEPLARSVILELRLPRVAGAFAVGALLALAGAYLQVLLGNPLADPYILGTSGGAAVGALIVLLLGGGAVLVSGGALAGALLSVAVVFTLAGAGGRWSTTRLLLTGVIVAAGWGALISFFLSVAPERDLRGMLFWLMGDLSHITTPWPALALAIAALFLSLPLARSLDLLARGELQASALGVEISRLRLALYFAAALLTAAAVTLGGSIGFLGLVVPHLMRLVVGSAHRLLLPAAALFGGTLLVLADTLARTAIAPRQLPVGVLTALIGVPVFLFLLQKSDRRRESPK
ncbi:FecCD family ABC transporter permease [Thiohalomonas denitrificans]|uniref:Iron complex transport system permease protein n=1 Tax=Thiohalomonas denitrificans TaxID=415747 RepID=A0A1G5PNM7_9GAMM|nr:iron ABC transporter permease [Thiohalomonas denitrificans]SCZ50720.1 iron complex transport system permease protein [Thiohalomonas denitrificans]